jgi:hypothetical protein
MMDQGSLSYELHCPSNINFFHLVPLNMMWTHSILIWFPYFLRACFYWVSPMVLELMMLAFIF